MSLTDRYKDRILKDKGVEITLVDIQTTEIHVKLLFKYSEFMAESGEVRVVE